MVTMARMDLALAENDASKAPSVDSRITVFLVRRVTEMVRAVNEQAQSFLLLAPR